MCNRIFGARSHGRTLQQSGTVPSYIQAIKYCRRVPGCPLDTPLISNTISFHVYLFRLLSIVLCKLLTTLNTSECSFHFTDSIFVLVIIWLILSQVILATLPFSLFCWIYQPALCLIFCLWSLKERYAGLVSCLRSWDIHEFLDFLLISKSLHT